MQTVNIESVRSTLITMCERSHDAQKIGYAIHDVNLIEENGVMYISLICSVKAGTSSKVREWFTDIIRAATYGYFQLHTAAVHYLSC